MGATDQNPAASGIDDNDGQAASAPAFITRWRGVTASELSTAQSFVIQLCELLGVEPPHPTPEQSYMFERPFPSSTATAAPAPAGWTATNAATSCGKARS